MPIAQKPKQIQVEPELIARQPSFLAAFNLMFNLSGLEDKEIYLALGIDAGHWSRIRKGDGHFPTDKIEPAMDLCDSEIPLQWLAMRRRFELRPLLSDIEQQLERERALRIRLEQKLETITDFLSQTQGRR